MSPTENEFSRRDLLRGAGALGVGAVIAVGAPRGSVREVASAAGPSAKRGGALTIGVDGGSSAETLDPANAVTTIDIARVAQLNETLLYFNPNFDLEHQLAESLEGSDSARRWVIRLRPGIEFHNGKTLSAADVRYTLLRILNPKSPGAAASAFANLAKDGIRILDGRTLELTFTQPYSSFPDVLALAATDAVRIVPEGFSLSHPIGTGPFMYKSFTPGVRSEFIRNPNYWRSGEPYVDSVIILDINDDTARVNALLSGQVNAIADLPVTSVSTVKSTGGLQVLSSQTGAWNPLVMRTDVPPFSDVHVRQAMRLLVERPLVIDSALDRQGAVANDLYGRYDPAYDYALPQRHQNIEQAKRLLDKAGYRKLSVPLITSDIAVGELQAPQVFAQNASLAGVSVTLNIVQPTDFWAKDFLQAPFTVSNWATRTFLLQAQASMLPNAPYNETHWHNAEWLKYVKGALGTTNASLQHELIHEAQKIEWNEGGYINWGWFNTVDAYEARVKGFVPDRGGINLTTFRLREVWFG